MSLLEQMECNAGGGKQAHTSELCEERLQTRVSLFHVLCSFALEENWKSECLLGNEYKNILTAKQLDIMFFTGSLRNIY